MSTVATTNKYTYDILLEEQSDGTYQAIALGWADCRAVAATAEAAVANVKEMLHHRIAKARIVRVEIDSPPVNTVSPPYEHPWMQFAERLKDNPLLDEVEQYIAESRHILDEN